MGVEVRDMSPRHRLYCRLALVSVIAVLIMVLTADWLSKQSSEKSAYHVNDPEMKYPDPQSVKTWNKSDGRQLVKYQNLTNRHNYIIRWHNSLHRKLSGNRSSVLTMKRESQEVLQKKNQSRHEGLVNDITVVTAYFKLGIIDKSGHFYTPDTYLKWIKIFGWLSNPLIVYVEDDYFAQVFENLRLDTFPTKTKIVKVSRSKLWAFSLLDRIKKIYQDPEYPKHSPGTVMPEYPCVMHAKYELMEKSVLENPFKTKYFSWLDIGLFRDISSYKTYPEFHLDLPPAFDDSKVSYTEVAPFIKDATIQEVFKFNMVWVCGCFFLAKHSVMLKWVREYMYFTEFYLDQGLMNSDQQIIYAVFQNISQVAARIQTYVGDGRYNSWFHLGYLCKEMGHKQQGVFVIRKDN